MRKNQTLSGAELSARPKAVPAPYTIRVRRDHGGGLWTFEDDEGQLYLAVKSRGFAEGIASAEEDARATGRAYGWKRRRAS